MRSWYRVIIRCIAARFRDAGDERARTQVGAGTRPQDPERRRFF